MKQFNENAYIAGVSAEKGVSEEYLMKLWNVAEEKVARTDTEGKGSPVYWQKVVKEFQELADSLDIEEARYIMNTREDYSRTANDFFNGLIGDDYSKADEQFAKMVDQRLRLMINKERDNYYQNVLADKANKLVAGE